MVLLIDPLNVKRLSTSTQLQSLMKVCPSGATRACWRCCTGLASFGLGPLTDWHPHRDRNALSRCIHSKKAAILCNEGVAQKGVESQVSTFSSRHSAASTCRAMMTSALSASVADRICRCHPLSTSGRLSARTRAAGAKASRQVTGSSAADMQQGECKDGTIRINSIKAVIDQFQVCFELWDKRHAAAADLCSSYASCSCLADVHLCYSLQ